jgi:Tfp pilus assembly protein PilN
MYTSASAKVSGAEEQKADAVSANVALRGDLNKLETVKQTYAKVDSASKTLGVAMHNEIRWSSYLHDLTLTIPENVWLNRLEVKMNASKSSSGGSNSPVLDTGLGTVKVEGSAFSHDDVAAWLESLAKQKGYVDPFFTKSEDRMEERVIVDFDSTAYLNAKALSNRYSKGLAR